MNIVVFFVLFFFTTNLCGQSMQDSGFIKNLYGINTVSDSTQILSSGRLNAQLNDYIDKTCYLIRLNPKLEVIDLPNMKSSYLKMKADLRNGKLQGVRTVVRNGVCNVNYEAQLLLLMTKLYFKQLQISYDVSLKSYFINDYIFSVKSTIDDFFIETGLLVDATNLKMTLNRLVIPKGSTITIQVSSESVLAWITNKLLSAYTYLFQNHIRKYIENNMIDAVQYALDNIPKYQKNDPLKVSHHC